MLTRTPILLITLMLVPAAACSADDELAELQRQLDLTPDPALAGRWEPTAGLGATYEFDVEGRWASFEPVDPDIPEPGEPSREEGMFGGDGQLLRLVTPFSLDVPGGYSGYVEIDQSYHVDGDLLSMFVVNPQGAVDGVVGTFSADDLWLFVSDDNGDRLESHFVSRWSFAADGTLTWTQSWRSEGADQETYEHAGTYQVTEEGVRYRLAGDSEDGVLYRAGDGLTSWRLRRAP